MTIFSTKQTTMLSLVALVCALFFTATVFIAHVLQTELDFFAHTLSLYALGDNGFVLEFGFYAIAATQLILSIFLLPSRWHLRSALPAIFLFLAGIGALLVGLFPTQHNPVDYLSRLPHITGAIMQFMFFPVSLLTLFSSLPDETARAYTKFSGVVALVLFFTVLVLFFVPAFKAFAFIGLVEKIDILIITMWLIYYSYAVLRLGHVAQATG